MKSKKVLFLSKLFDLTGLNFIGNKLNKVLYCNNFIRVVNYHATPHNSMDSFEKHLKHYSKYYKAVNYDDLEKLLQGKLNLHKPGIILSFDDAFVSNYNEAADILEKYGFKGWFFIPVNCVENREQLPCNLHNNENVMDWNQVKDLIKRGHMVGSHTLSHKRMASNLSIQKIRNEIVNSKKLLEKRINHDVSSFCWVGGELENYNTYAQRIIEQAEYTFSFTTNHKPITQKTNPLMLDRTNIEAIWPMHLLRFYTTFWMDIKYLPKRRKVHKKLFKDINDENISI